MSSSREKPQVKTIVMTAFFAAMIYLGTLPMGEYWQATFIPGRKSRRRASSCPAFPL